MRRVREEGDRGRRVTGERRVVREEGGGGGEEGDRGGG